MYDAAALLSWIVHHYYYFPAFTVFVILLRNSMVVARHPKWPQPGICR
ncbi:hypothetical protein [Oryzomonas sagensis]|nr:hypothetical protein [Oryzomonas sagensis]